MFNPLTYVTISSPQKFLGIVRLVPNGISTNVGGKFNHNSVFNTKNNKYYVKQLSKEISVTLRPTTLDEFLNSMPQPTNIIHPKDSYFLLNYLNLNHESRVLEAGSGSGSLSSTLFPILKLQSWDSYELVPRHFEAAVNNFSNWFTHNSGGVSIDDFHQEKANPIVEFTPHMYNQPVDLLHDNFEFLQKGISPAPGITFHLNSVLNGLENQYDAIILDLIDPEIYIERISLSLSTYGRVACFLPNITQAVDLSKNILKNQLPLKSIGTFETQYRRWTISPALTVSSPESECFDELTCRNTHNYDKMLCRPDFYQNVNHTGFIHIFEKF